MSMLRSGVARRLCLPQVQCSYRRASSGGIDDSGKFRASELPPSKKPRGFVRGGTMGLLLGVLIAGSTAYYHLLDDYQVYSSAMLTDVQKLKSSVDALKLSQRKNEKLEAEVKRLRGELITRDELDKSRKDIHKAHDELTIEHLELKTRVWALEQELKSRK